MRFFNQLHQKKAYDFLGVCIFICVKYISVFRMTAQKALWILIIDLKWVLARAVLIFIHTSSLVNSNIPARRMSCHNSDLK